MKKFKASKLILSGVALAATAATLSSTTYAWYVSNDKADASEITGYTGGTDVSGNLLVAHNKYTSNVYTMDEPTQSIKFEAGSDITLPAKNLAPVTKGTSEMKTLTADTLAKVGKTYYIAVPVYENIAIADQDELDAATTAVTLSSTAASAYDSKTVYYKLVGGVLVAQDIADQTAYDAATDLLTVTTGAVGTYAAATKYYIPSTTKYVALTAAEVVGAIYKAKFAADSTHPSTEIYEDAWVSFDGGNVKKVTGAASYMEFNFWIESTSKTNIKTEISVSNTTDPSAVKMQSLHNTTGGPNGVLKNGEFYKDAIDAMRMEVFQSTFDDDHKASTSNLGLYNLNNAKFYTGTKLTGAAVEGDANSYYSALLQEVPYGCTNTTTWTKQTGLAEKYFNLHKSSLWVRTGSSGSYAYTENGDASYSSSKEYCLSDGGAVINLANEYLKDNVGKIYIGAAADTTKPTNPVKATASDTVDEAAKTYWTMNAVASESVTHNDPLNDLIASTPKITLEAGKATLLTFRIWLEGTDADCFDSCIAQSFELNVHFTAIN